MFVLNDLINEIKTLNPGHGAQLQQLMLTRGDEFLEYTDLLLNGFKSYWESENLESSFMAQCYLQIQAREFETVHSNKVTEKETEIRHTYGRSLAKTLLPGLYEGLQFFSEYVSQMDLSVRHYLETGSGYGLFMREAIHILGGEVRYDLVDSNLLSMEISQALIQDERVNFLPVDLLTIEPLPPYDFITIGGIEDGTITPLELLEKAHSLLEPEGRVFFTSLAYLAHSNPVFTLEDSRSIHDYIEQGGFEIEEETYHFGERLSPSDLERGKPLTFSVILKKS